jgi:predicted TIM-barrel fold metal-dependent hydrolase
VAMIDDVFVFDSVAHVLNMDPGNSYGPPGISAAQSLYKFHAGLTPADRTVLTPEQFLRRWTPEDVHTMVFAESQTDMLVSMPLPLTDMSRTGFSSVEDCVALQALDPDRIVFWGSVNPLEGRLAINEMERQVGEHNARAFKFYNTRYDFGQPFGWRMDDPQIAFPIFEKMQELGVDIVGCHKGLPLGPQPIEQTQVWDIDGAAAAFPDLKFVIFHPGLPFLDETLWQAIRHDNVYVSLAATVNLAVRAPRQFAEILAKLLFWCGEDRIVFGSESPIFHPQWALESFWNFEIPDDLVTQYLGAPLTHQAKRKILGENLLRLHHIDPAQQGKPGPPNHT